MPFPSLPLLSFAALLILLTTAFLRLLLILPGFNHQPPKPRKRNDPSHPIHLLVVLGSGGHTAEMLSMLSNPHFSSETYTHRSYVISEGDAFSAGKALEFEQGLMARQEQSSTRKEGERVGYTVHMVPRARQIHQSLLTTPLTSLRCLVAAISLLRSHHRGKPDLILTNGPATALIIVIAGLVMECFSFLNRWDSGSGRTRSIYVESWARVRRPSLSCWIIVNLGLCNQVLVQWPQLEEAGWGQYRGVLVQ